MSLPDDLDAASAATLAAAVAERGVSALELCDAAIARIEARDVAVNAVVVRDFERAREQARERDARAARGERGPLLGVPMTVKESFAVAGLPSTWGFERFAGFRPAEDALLVQRLKAAGAVILGKTNVPPGLADWQSANPVYGRTVNPRDATRSPGGSSGGSAAAVAAGLVPLELGSDIGGSVRVPAHFCGVCAHKPSVGLLPLGGHAFPGSDGAPVDLPVAGPLARHVADLDLALDVLAGPDAREAVAWRLALPAPRRTRLADWRVLWLDAHPAAAVDAPVREALAALAPALEGAGVRIERASPLLPDLAAAHKAYVALLMTAITRGQPPGAQPVIDAHRWLELLDERERVRRRWRALFEAFDVVVAPPFGTTAFAHVDEPDWSRRTLLVDGRPTPFGDQLAWSGMATFAGLPATIVPIATAADGLPIGAQLIGPFLEDRSTIAFAREVAALVG